MHKIIFYPVGNGDTSQIILDNEKRLLFDFRHQKKTENGDCPEINLKQQLQDELDKDNRDYFDVVAFTHSDKDHIENSTEFFELLHEKQYQGEGRIKINELWVPAAMILETAPRDKQSSEFIIWRQEARYRLREGKGVRVFSKPDELKKWFENEKNISLEDRKHLITDAGKTVEGFTLENDGVEFFCHSPFIKHVDDGDDLRNKASLIFNVRFKSNDKTFDYLLVGDSECEVLEDIVEITQYHNNEDRLKWDLFNIPHHCSYKALSDEKGAQKTAPKPKVKELLLLGKENAYCVSSSKPIENNSDAEEQTQPPHIQAKRCYEKYLDEIDGTDFIVTMETPSEDNPEPLIFEISGNGLKKHSKAPVAAVSVITSTPAPRAGDE